MGGSSIVGPSSVPPNIFYYAGKPYLSENAAEGVIASATIDLSLVNISFLNDIWTKPEWRPDLYKSWMDDVLQTDFLK
jgi:hypothetical protein